VAASGFWDVLLAACALMLVVEGLLPFFSPGAMAAAVRAGHPNERRADPLPGAGSMMLGLAAAAVVLA
jgi:uncharacterized protein YjeT (DUF2065 family)